MRLGVVVTVLLLFCVLAAFASNSNYIIVDNIKYKTATDKSVYYFAEIAHMSHSVTNLGDEPEVFGLSCYNRISGFTIRSGDSLVWTTGCYTTPRFETLAPGDSFVSYEDWNLTDTGGYPVDVGIYRVIGYLETFDDNHRHQVEVEVEVREPVGVTEPPAPTEWSKIKALFR